MSLLQKFRNAKGQAVVELALILPILLMLLMGIFEFGRVFNTYLILTHASREGARLGALGKNDTQIISTITQTASYLDTANLNIYITPGESERIRGSSITVKLDYTLDILMPLVGSFLPDPFVVSAQTIMRIE